MKKLPIVLLFSLALLFSTARADGLAVEPYAGGFRYAFQAEEEFLILKVKTDAESVQATIVSEDGEFSGDFILPHTLVVSPLKVTVETLKGREVLSAKAETLAVEEALPAQNLLETAKDRKLNEFAFTPLVNAIRYHFRAPGYASLLLKYRSSTEKGISTLYAGKDYAFDGVLLLPYTYANNNVVLTVTDMKNNDLYEEMLRTGYSVPEAPPQGAGRLSGVTVCIDPGHQEAGQYVSEALGPGLSGTKKGDIGMARGTVTRRMESIVVLEIGFLLRDALLAEGAAVVLTRDTQDIYVSNIRRAEIAAEVNADFFLRLHCDSRVNAAAQGIGIFCPYGSDYAKAVADRDGWQAMGEILLAAMQSATGQTKGTVTTTNAYVGNNWAKMPSFLIEMGYMSNPVEDVLLSSPQYQQKLVEGMAEGIYRLAVERGLLAD